MNYKQILNRLASKPLVEALDYDLALVTGWEMLAPKGTVLDHNKVSSSVIYKMRQRWNCALSAPKDEVSVRYANVLRIAFQVLLHKYGFENESVTREALQAIDELNHEVALDDHFYRKTEEIKAFMRSPAVPLRKRPGRPKEQTFWRSGDVVSYQLEDRFYALYVLEISGANETPLVEFYDFVSERRPSLLDLSNKRARGLLYNDGVCRQERFYVHGMRNVPDPANQLHLLGNVPDSPPCANHLAPPVGYGSVIDIFRLQCDVRRLFSESLTLQSSGTRHEATSVNFSG